MTLGDKVKTLRKGNKMTQEQLGEHLEMTRSAINKWERNRSVVPTKKIIALSNLFHVPVSFFFEGVDE